jgi:hypothetical protein
MARALESKHAWRGPRGIAAQVQAEVPPRPGQDCLRLFIVANADGGAAVDLGGPRSSLAIRDAAVGWRRTPDRL